jgi:hypothetical protein
MEQEIIQKKHAIVEFLKTLPDTKDLVIKG